MENWLNDDGTKYRLFPSELVQNDYDNPYWVLNKMPRTDKTNRLTANVTLDLNITDWWSINYNLGTDRYTSNTRRFTEPGSGVSLAYSRQGLLSEGDRTYEYLISNLMTNFHKQFGDFDFNLLLGTSAEATEVLYNGRKGWDFLIPGFYNVTNTTETTRSISQSKMQKRLVGFYGEFRASYKNLAYVTVTGRNDWTSTLPIESRSYFYPSVSGSFVFTELLPKNNILSFGKVRASWARVGKDADAYADQTFVKSQFTIYNEGNGLGVRNDELQDRGNPSLIPEITQSQEYGIELRFFDGRLNIDYAFYQNKTINQLVKPRMPQSPGYITALTNAGTVVNNGMELSINVVPVQTKDFRWDLTINASGNRGEVVEILPGLDYLYLTDVQYSNAKAASFPGGSFMAISGSQWLRSPEGYIVVNKTTGMPTSDGLVNHQVGDREPKVFGGVSSSLQYKNWNLSFLLDYRIGGDVFNGTDWYLTNNGMSARTQGRESLTITGVWNTGNKDADGNPIYSDPQTYEYKAGEMYSIGSQQSGEYVIRNYFADPSATVVSPYNLETANYITDVNWLRLRSVSLSYSLPDSILRKLKVVKNLTATVTGTNLFVWTNYKGLDPETSAAGSGIVGPTSVGIDYCGVPALAGVSFGLNLTF
jgi:outer membrane receptor protein involved in Fe transport